MTQQTLVPTEGSFQTDFERLIQSFRVIATITSPTERRFRLNRIAPFHGLPRAEFRKIFEIWLLEQAQGGQR